jgi:WD40 repeat protein/serine/threonine protein kinase
MNENQDQTQRDRQARDIFLRALEIQSADARAGYIEGACHQDESLRSRVEALLKSHQQDSFLEAPALEGAATFLAATSMSEGPGTVIGHYKLLQKLGEGGFGVVYMAEQKEPVKRRVALKIIKLGMDTQQVVARFEAERQALAMMDHPNIAKVLDGGATHTGRPYFVMELVKGVPVTKYCDDNQLTTRERLELFIAVCQAIQHAHQKGIVHRDIKPSNIMVTLHDGVPVPKVIDFGIAKATQQELTEKTIFTQYSQFIGTPAYMSPEQAELSGLDIDTRSDIYSLGVVLYELLVGQTPLDAKELLSGGYDEIRRRIKEQEPPKPSTRVSTFEGELGTVVARHRKSSPSQLSSQLRGDLDWIVLKALEKDRTRRYETASGFARDLQRCLAHEPVTAVAPSTAYLLKKYIRRHRAGLAVAASIGLLLVAGTTVSIWQAVRANQARRAAEAANEAERAQRQAAQIERDKAGHAQQETERAHEAEKHARERAVAGEMEARQLLYAAQMNLAQQAWQQHNIGQLRQLLSDTQSFPNRGFEWDYWQRQVRLGVLKTFRVQKGKIGSTALSPHGDRIVTAGLEDNTAKVWDSASGRELLTLTGHTKAVVCTTFSPDGKRIITGSMDETVRVWDAADGRELLTLKASTNGVWCVAISPDGQRLAAGGNDSLARVWSLPSGHELMTLAGSSNVVMGLAFSPDGQRLATGGDQTIKLWDAITGQNLLTLQGHSNLVASVAFSPDGKHLASGSADQTVRIWDTTTGKELRTLKGHTDLVMSVAFSPDGRRIVSACLDRTAKIWDTSTGQELKTLVGHTEGGTSAVFSADGQRVFTASFDKTVRVWDASENPDRLTLRGHTGPIRSVAFFPDGRRIVTAGDDGTARIWEARTGSELLRISVNSDTIWSVSVSPDGHRIATATLAPDNVVRIWDASTGKECLTLTGHTGPVGAIAFSPDGKQILTGSKDATAKLWDAATGHELRTFPGHSNWVTAVAFSPEGQRIVTGSGDRTARLWNAASGQELLKLPHPHGLLSAAFSPDGRRILTGNGGGTAHVWDAEVGRELLCLRGHNGQVWSAIYSSDGQRILTGSRDRTAKLWDAVSGRELLSLSGHGAGLSSAVFSPEGDRIVTGSWDWTACIWQKASSAEIADWQKEESTQR